MREGRENDPNFGSRMVGKGTLADLLSQRFRKAVTRFGLERDFRELDCSLFVPPSLNGQKSLVLERNNARSRAVQSLIICRFFPPRTQSGGRKHLPQSTPFEEHECPHCRFRWKTSTPCGFRGRVSSQWHPGPPVRLAMMQRER